MANQPRQCHSSTDGASSGLSFCQQHEAPSLANMGLADLDATIVLNNLGVALLEMGRFQEANETLRDAFVVWRMGNDASAFCVHKKIQIARQRLQDDSKKERPVAQLHVNIISFSEITGTGVFYPAFDISEHLHNMSDSVHVHPIILGDGKKADQPDFEIDFYSALLLYNIGLSLYCTAHTNRNATMRQSLKKKSVKFFQLSYASLSHHIAAHARSIRWHETCQEILNHTQVITLLHTGVLVLHALAKLWMGTTWRKDGELSALLNRVARIQNTIQCIRNFGLVCHSMLDTKLAPAA